MHLESGLKEEKAPQIISRNLRYDDKELETLLAVESIAECLKYK